MFSLVSIIALLWIVRVFPLDFSSRLGDWFNILFRVVLIVALVGTLIGGITHFVKFIQALFRGEPQREEREDQD
ncbi:MAG: hypothetical protein A2V99_05230 [Spirochaetes bacterium RBG_16_67_19]|nr:MAG: hypothetical protein A2V99_05230 [Spirochaetes bacterium RBG_16_67_19]